MIIKVFPSESREPRETVYKMSSNTYEVYNTMLKSERFGPWTADDISIAIDMSKRDVVGCLTGLGKLGLVKKVDGGYFVTPVEEEIKVKHINNILD